MNHGMFSLGMLIENPETGEKVRFKSSLELVEALRPTYESFCAHPNKVVRRRTVRGGAFQIKEQCEDCGQAVGQPLSSAKFSAVPPFDEELLKRKDHERKCLQWKIAHEFEALAKRRELESQKAYDNYLASTRWQQIRSRVMKRSNGICEGCGVEPASDVHHLTYKNFGEEFLFELVAICRACHDRCHGSSALDHDDRPCRSCRFQGSEDHCVAFGVPENAALQNDDLCGRSLRGFQPLK